MAKTTVTVEGREYELVHNFGLNRGIINLDGAFALVDRVGAAQWELSGNPATDDEKPVLQNFVDTIGTSTTVTAPDGSVTTFMDEGAVIKR